MVPPPARSALRLWHGGAPGRQPGELLLPPTVTGLRFTRRTMSMRQGMTQIGQTADRVYVTTDRDLAAAYASLWSLDGAQQGGGALYRVTAEEADLEADADLLSLPGVSFQAPAAEVLSVYNAHVPFDEERSRRAIQRVLSAHDAAKVRRRGSPS